MHRKPEFLLSPRDRATLQRWIRAPTTPQRTVRRSRIVLLLADGESVREVARRAGVSRQTVMLWRSRFIDEGCPSLTRDRPGRGRKRGAGAPPDDSAEGAGEENFVTARDVFAAPASCAPLERARDLA